MGPWIQFSEYLKKLHPKHGPFPILNCRLHRDQMAVIRFLHPMGQIAADYTRMTNVAMK